MLLDTPSSISWWGHASSSSSPALLQFMEALWRQSGVPRLGPFAPPLSPLNKGIWFVVNSLLSSFPFNTLPVLVFSRILEPPLSSLLYSCCKSSAFVLVCVCRMARRSRELEDEIQRKAGGRARPALARQTVFP